ncbi:ribosome small subunit-dependent GTPase A [Vagococcus hydrophili]|uniref:Small ribosomal subunit biogenesis GTPase RsgA n=1 Tax=Vagococcus hydrophili TaxID=2714947 RepID=A0A6G8ARV1_9ENTE|nr:ribosome small subunit-dependent GTPase A [Vagococcus hydrophili]QIL47801.1 ribosome small subunit-dependent GTPase A [Vagococcus hydrophili]
MPKGQIRKALSGFYYIYHEGETYQTRGRGNFRNRNITPLVGDWVEFESSNLTDGYVLDVFERENELIRPAVANIDLGVVVTSCVKPNFSFNLLDRFLVTLESKKIQPIIYITKLDLATEEIKAEMANVKKYYESVGYPVLYSESGNTDNLTAYFKDKLTVFMGQSGAGKSTLLNKIAPSLDLEVGDISEALGRGRHTTRHVELIELNGGLVADTPGFSSIEFLEMSLEELPKYFPEFLEASEFCKFRECMHHKEPKCEVKHRLEEGNILQSRYDNYLQFYEEIKTRKPKYNKKEK